MLWRSHARGAGRRAHRADTVNLLSAQALPVKSSAHSPSNASANRVNSLKAENGQRNPETNRKLKAGQAPAEKSAKTLWHQYLNLSNHY